MPDSRTWRSLLLRATPRRGPGQAWHIVRKPDHKRPAADMRASPPGPLNATAWRTSIPARSATPTRNTIRRISHTAARSVVTLR